LDKRPENGDDQATHGCEAHTLEKSDEMKAVVAIGSHPFGARQHHRTGLNGTEEQPIQDEEVEQVEHQQDDP